MTDTRHADEAIDAAAAKAFFTENGVRAEKLPPVAIVIAAYNEEGVVGSVTEALPATLCGLTCGFVGGLTRELRPHRGDS